MQLIKRLCVAMEEQERQAAHILCSQDYMVRSRWVEMGVTRFGICPKGFWL